MSETKHTPGPWTVLEGKTLLHIETSLDNPAGAGIHICSIPKTEQGWANARLIAAASDNLARLVNATRNVHGRGVKGLVKEDNMDCKITTISDARRVIGEWTERYSPALTDDELDRAARKLVKHIGGYGEWLTEELSESFDVDAAMKDAG